MEIKGDKLILKKITSETIVFEPFEYLNNYNKVKTGLLQRKAFVAKAIEDAENITPEKILIGARVPETESEIKQFEEEEKFLLKYFNRAKALHRLNLEKQKRAKKVKGVK
jgi:hypothetical protein